MRTAFQGQSFDFRTSSVIQTGPADALSLAPRLRLMRAASAVSAGTVPSPSGPGLWVGSELGSPTLCRQGNREQTRTRASA